MADEEIQDPQVDEVEGALAEAEEEELEEQEQSLEDKLKEVIETDVEDLGSLRKKLTIRVPRETLDEQTEEQYGELRREAQVPGFRKGRAPRRLLEKRFGRDVNETLLSSLVGTSYQVALDKIEIKVIGDPLIWAKKKDAEVETLVEVKEAVNLLELPTEGPFEFSCEVEVRPEFKLPDIEGIPIEKPVIKVTDENVDDQIKRYLSMRGSYQAISEGVVEKDDLLDADLTMTSEGKQIKQQSGVQVAARPQMIEGVALEDLDTVLVGAKIGDTRSISGTIPDDYAQAEYRGKQADFEITVKAIRRLKVPELDEQFIQMMGFDSEQELRDFIRNDLESRIEEQVRQNMSAQVYNYLYENTDFELPARLSERQTDRVVARRMIELYRQGVPPVEAEKHMDELKTSAKEQAAHDLKLAFIMEALAEEVEVEVSESEINGVIASIAQRQGRRFDRVRDELIKQNGIVNLYVQLRDDKIVAQLIEKARITEKEPEKAEEEPSSEKEKSGSKTKKKSASKPKSPKKTKEKEADDLADET